MPDDSPALTYGSYLALDDLLAAQRPRSDEHDELLFIVIHQVYELWFKQLLHELARVQDRLEAGDTNAALGTLKRVLTILKVVVAQIDVLETMTPLQFLGFRDRLDAASGFQSAQFREIEAVIGRRGGRPTAAASEPSLYDAFLRYLTTQGYDLPADVLDRDVTTPYDGDDRVQQVLLRVYRDDGAAAGVAERLVDLDEGLQEWRYRHVKMVERTIGAKPGTGGSMGAAYLRSTLAKPAFPDLWEIRGDL